MWIVQKKQRKKARLTVRREGEIWRKKKKG
jgi:hypothetical protein